MLTRTDFATIIPVLIVTLAGCFVLVAEAIRRKGDVMPHALLAAIGLGGAIYTSVAQWGENNVGFGVIVADNFALFFNVAICGMGLLTVMLRLVFALAAEDRGLVPSEHPIYAAHLSVGGLYDELQADQDAYADTMDQRFGAWARLVMLFRALYFGVEYGGLSMPPHRQPVRIHAPRLPPDLAVFRATH